jgi:hypothetical protein
MKRLVLITLLTASMASAVTWSRIFDTEEWDDFRCVQEVDEGYIVTGFTNTYGPGDKALWLLKIDTMGNTIWSKTYAGTGDSTGQGNFVQPTNDGGYIIAGKLFTTLNQIWLLKTDDNGDTVWTKNYGSSIGYCVQQTHDGGYIVTGRRDWNDYRLFLLKTDSNGDSIWMRTYLQNDWVHSMGYFVDLTDDGGFIVAGLIEDTTFEDGRTACWIIRTDSLGDTTWTYIQGGVNWHDFDNGRCARQTEDSQYIALANFGLIRINLEGDSLWTQPYADGSCVQQTEDEGYVLSGNAVKLASFVTSPKPNPDEAWLLKTDTLGDTEWRRAYFEGITYYVAETRDKGFIIAGRNIDDPFLIKTDSLGLLGVTEEPVIEPNEGWKIGSPIGSRIALFYDDLPQGLHAKVYNSAGQQVDEVHVTGSRGFITWGIGYPPGIYFIQAPNKLNQAVTAKVVILH